MSRRRSEPGRVTEGEAETIAALVDSLRESIDGVVILSSRETIETGVELVEMLQRAYVPASETSVETPTPESEAPKLEAPQESNLERPSMAMILLQLLAIILSVAFAVALYREVKSRKRTR